MNKRKEQSGFTLIEILVVIGIIAILAVIVLIAINPGRQFAQSRNTQRTSNVNAILNAIGQNLADNKGVFTCTGAVLDATPRLICDSSAAGCTGNTVDLGCLTPIYIPALPTDPKGGNYQWTSDANYNTGYTVEYNASTTRITVKAPEAELSQSIEITR